MIRSDGFYLMYSVRGRRILQQIWSTKLEWSQAVPEEIQTALESWVSEMVAFRNFRTPRQFTPSVRIPIRRRLHVFGDASPLAYAAAAYIENVYDDGASAFALVMCRSRLAPRDAQKFPRLELLAALMAVRLKNFLVDRLTVERFRLSTDSTITFHWVTSTNPGWWRTFIYNRVKEIQASSRPELWYHIRGDSNIADLATRGIRATELVENPEWFFGPSWLSLPEGQQPISQPHATCAESLHLVQSEIKRISAPVLPRDRLIDIARYSSLGRVLRVMINVLRFTYRARRRDVPDSREMCRLAEAHLIAVTQAEFFGEELARIRAGQRPPSTSKLAAFSLFIDKGLLRARTRLTEGTLLTYDEKNPVIIPGESHLARLLIIDTHRINAHFGVATVLAHLRRRYWVTRGRQIVKSLLNRCVICRKKQSRHGSQIEAPLPSVRVDLYEAFETSGIDFCGPFFTRHRRRPGPADVVQQTRDAKGKKVAVVTYATVRTYVAVFTCTTTRGVHLEAVPSLTAPQTLLAIRRFLAMYPACRRFVSDNGARLVKADTEIKRIFNSRHHPELKDLFQSRMISWDFNCPVSPWRGGFFERVVSIMKAALPKTLGKSLVGYEEFRTILLEMSAAINSRPLTYVSDDPGSLTPITPGHFIRGGPSRAPISKCFACAVKTSSQTTKQPAEPVNLRKLQHLQDKSI